MKRFCLYFLWIACCCGCAKPSKKPAFSHRDIYKVYRQMMDLMIHDVTSPPLASRFFAYVSLAGYEVVSTHTPSIRSMHGVLNGYPQITIRPAKATDYQLSALLAMMKVAARMQPSGQSFSGAITKLTDSLSQTGFDQEMLQASSAYADSVAAQILKYARADGYNKLSSFPRYEPAEKEGQWYPTPPAYISAVEPYYNRVRTFTLDSVQQFKPLLPIPFSKVKGSAFFRLMEKNYRDTLTKESGAIAEFWDCNPFAVEARGHLLSAVKKISPGAHWIGITAIACEKKAKNFDQSIEILTRVALTLSDAFASCWDEKYRSNRIRPETAIRQYIDPEWHPLLQTPPFPEYTSGHSVISAAASVVLTDYFGDGFAYDDDIEVPFGLPVRHFSSFNQAMHEAAISRFYGGIHYLDAIENGVAQGTNVGKWTLRKLGREK